MKSIHIMAAAVALGIVWAVLAAGVDYADRVEEQYIHALAPLHPPLNITGIALQKAAFSQSDLLPVYGASEALNQPSEFQADQFFKSYPTGFAPYDIVKGGDASIIHAESAAAVGATLQGKKVVISFTPSQFTGKMMGASAYAGLFSRLHANALVFSSQLRYETKQWAARRMLQYPDTLKGDPILKFTLEQLAQNTWLSRLLYGLVYPLGKLQTLILELQDHYATLTYIASLKQVTPEVGHRSAAINWAAQLAKAHQEQTPNADNNPYGFDNVWWKNHATDVKTKPIPKGDTGFVKALDGSMEWNDLALLLQILKELGAQPLLLGRPTNADYYHAIGVSDAALQHYYDKLDQLANQYGVRVIDFRNFQDDRYFGVDPAPHTSREGWVYVDQTLDTFYHQPAEQPGAAHAAAGGVLPVDYRRFTGSVRQGKFLNTAICLSRILG